MRTSPFAFLRKVFETRVFRRGLILMRASWASKLKSSVGPGGIDERRRRRRQGIRQGREGAVYWYMARRNSGGGASSLHFERGERGKVLSFSNESEAI